MKFLANAVKKFCLILIKAYQLVVSPLFPPSCRHVPCCSEYAKEAIRNFGVRKGVWLALKRILSCHPWGSAGYDPLDTNR